MNLSQSNKMPRSASASGKGASLYSTGALVLSCGLVYPFLEGHPLHSHWESFGKYLLFLPMVLLLVFLYCNGLWWGAWQARRGLEKE